MEWILKTKKINEKLCFDTIKVNKVNSESSSTGILKSTNYDILFSYS